MRPLQTLVNRGLMTSVPTLAQVIALMKTNPEITLDLEAQAYSSIIKATETAEHFGRCYAELGPTLLEYGRKIGNDLPPLEVSATPEGDAPVVGFIIHSAAILAHTKRLMDFLAGGPTRIRPIIYCLSPKDETFEANMGGFKVRFIKTTPLKTLLDLRCYAEIDRVQAMVFVSLPLWMHTAAAMKIAPKLVWWCMKYHNLHIPELDGQLSGHPLFHKTYDFNGIPFRCVHSAVTGLYDSLLAVEAGAVRENIRDRQVGPILGVMVREEKYTREYVKAVGEILRRNPTARFIYTGRTNRADMQEWLKEEQIDTRCLWVGWVNTKLYAQVIDIYLDTFPMPSGQCAFEAMAAGVPVTVLNTREALESSVMSVALPLQRWGVSKLMSHEQRVIVDDLCASLLFAADTEHYVNVASMLCSDAEMRVAKGTICYNFIAAILQDVPRYVRTVEDHLLEIIHGQSVAPRAAPPRVSRPVKKGAKRKAVARSGRKSGGRKRATPPKSRAKKKAPSSNRVARKARTNSGRKKTPRKARRA